eukprot:PhM_4_TR10576/c1_g2_i1/m.56783
MKTTCVALLVLIALVAGANACHNSTGACHHAGKYECLDGTKIAWAQRCDGHEDCADGMDEFMCPASAPGHHEVHEQASCGPKCACQVSETIVSSSSIFFNFATHAPTWGDLMTGTPVNGLWGCNPDSSKTNSVTMLWYKKGSETCKGNHRKHGFICCGRQKLCGCSATGAGARCS